MNMPRLNQNQRIQTLTMLARGDNVSNVSRAFGFNRNTIMGWQIAVDPLDRGLQTLGTGRFVMLTHLRRRFQTAASSARQYGISKQTMWRRLRQARQPIRPRRPYVGQVLTACHWAARLQWQNSISVGSDSSGLGLYSLMSLGLTLVIMTVKFEFLEEEGTFC